MDPLNTGVVLRMIQDDMDAFKATVTDYDKYAEKIEEIKRNIPPHQLTQKGLHRQIYINVKSSDPEFAARLMEPGAPAAEGEVPPETPPAAKTVPVAAHTRTAPQAKPVPPALPPTPGSRTSAPPPAAATTKLKPNEKIIKFCRATGQDVTQYLSRLEQMGQTQADIDAPSTATQSAPRSVYDRSLAKR
jgi:hypothetical protein